MPNPDHLNPDSPESQPIAPRREEWRRPTDDWNPRIGGNPKALAAAVRDLEARMRPDPIPNWPRALAVGMLLLIALVCIGYAAVALVDWLMAR